MSRSPSGRCEPSALIPLVVVVGRIREGITGEISQEWRNGPNINKEITPLLTQNLKAIGYGSSFLYIA